MPNYILIRKSSSKKWGGIIPIKKGVSLSKLDKSIRSRIKPGYSYRIVSGSQVKRLLLSTMKKKMPVRRRRKKAVRRRR